MSSFPPPCVYVPSIIHVCICMYLVVERGASVTVSVSVSGVRWGLACPTGFFPCSTQRSAQHDEDEEREIEQEERSKRGMEDA